MTTGGYTVSTQVTLASLGTVSVAPGVVRQWLFNANDSRIVRAEAALQFPVGTVPPSSLTGVRGRFVVSLSEQIDKQTYRHATQPKELKSLENGGFVLGEAVGRLKAGSRVYIQIEYEAVSAVAGEPVFWKDAQAFNISVQLEP